MKLEHVIIYYKNWFVKIASKYAALSATPTPTYKLAADMPVGNQACVRSLQWPLAI